MNCFSSSFNAFALWLNMPSKHGFRIHGILGFLAKNLVKLFLINLR